MKKRSLRNLLKEMTRQEFERFCSTLAEEYARTDYEYARKFFCNKYNITQACYYKCLEYAVVHNLVDDFNFSEIMHKSAYNQNAYYLNKMAREGKEIEKDLNISSIAKYNRLFEERCKFIANSWTLEMVDEIATKYANERKSSKYQLSIKNKVSPRVIDYVIERAVREKRISPQIIVSIIQRDQRTAKRNDTNFKFKNN